MRMYRRRAASETAGEPPALRGKMASAMQLLPDDMRRWVILLLLIAACSHKTPEQKLLDDVDPAASWVATLQLAGEKWLADSVPTSFVRGCVGGAEKEFDKTSKAIGKSPARPALRDKIRRQIEIARAAAGHLKEAVQKNDRLAVADSVKQFAAAHAALQDSQ